MIVVENDNKETIKTNINLGDISKELDDLKKKCSDVVDVMPKLVNDYGEKQKNKTGKENIEKIRPNMEVVKLFLNQLDCLKLIYTNTLYQTLHKKTKELLDTMLGLFKNESSTNENIDKGTIEKYVGVVSNFCEKNKSNITGIFLEAAQIKNEYEVDQTLNEYQSTIKNNTKNDQINNSDKQISHTSENIPKCIYDKNSITAVAENSYFQKMLYDTFINYKDNNGSKSTLEVADTYIAFRNLSLDFSNLIKVKYLGSEDLSEQKCHQNQKSDEFLIEYVKDDKFKEFKFQNKPVSFINDMGNTSSHSYYDDISEKACEISDKIAKIFVSNNLIFKDSNFKEAAGATNGPGVNNDCFICSLLSHISIQEMKNIKKFVDENKKCVIPIWNDSLELSQNQTQEKDLFDFAGGTMPGINGQAKIIAYVRAALAIKIAKKQPDRLKTRENWEEFLTLLGHGPEKNINGEIDNWKKRDINGQSNMLAQAVVDLTGRPFILVYDGIDNGYLLRTTTPVLDNDEPKVEFGLVLGDFKFNTIYAKHNNNYSNTPSESLKNAKEELFDVNRNLLSLINDKDVISVKLCANGNIKTGNTSGHFYAIGKNYTGETLTTDKNNNVLNELVGKENLDTNSEIRKILTQLGFTENNENMPSYEFAGNGNNITGLKEIFNFLQMINKNNVKSNFDKWFKALFCRDDGKINESKFVNQIIKLFCSQNGQSKLFKDNDKVTLLNESISIFLSYVPVRFHSKWFQVVCRTFDQPVLFYKDTVIEKLRNIKLGTDNGIKYFGYLIGKFVKFVEDSTELTQAVYDNWKTKFISSNYLDSILTYKNDIENNFLKVINDEKFNNNDDITRKDLFRFIRLFDPSDLYVLIGVVEKEKDCNALEPLYNLSPKTVSNFFTLFRKFLGQEANNQNKIKDDEKNNDNNDIKKEDSTKDAHVNLIKLLRQINSKNPNGILDKIISGSKSFEQLKGYLEVIKSIDENRRETNLEYLSSLKEKERFNLLDYIVKNKACLHFNLSITKGILDALNSNTNIQSKNTNNEIQKVNSFGIGENEGVKNFFSALDFESFKKVLGYFEQEKEKEKKENNEEKEKKEAKQESFLEFIKDKKYAYNDIQKIVSVSNSLDEIKNNLKSLNDTLEIDQCKDYYKDKNETGFWSLFTGIKNSISKIFSSFKNNKDKNKNADDELSLKYIASALNEDGAEGENARIMFYTMSKNMDPKDKETLWEKVSKYIGNKGKSTTQSTTDSEKKTEISTDTKT